MKALRQPLLQQTSFSEDMHYLRHHPQACLHITDICDAAKLHVTDALCEPFRFRLFITYSELRAKSLSEEYAFYDPEVVFFPGKDLIFYQADIHAGETTRARMRCIRKIIEGKPLTVITTFAALMTPIVPADVIREHVLTIRKGDVLPSDMAARLVEMGYTRSHQAETPGEFAIRGDILDIFDITADNPCRIELWGDEVDNVRIFDAETQRSIETRTEVTVYPASEMILPEDVLYRGFRKIEQEAKQREEELRKAFQTEEAHRIKTQTDMLREQLFTLSMQVNLESYIRYFYEEPDSFPALLDAAHTCLIFDEPARIREHAEASEKEFTDSMTLRSQTGYILPGQTALLSGTEALLEDFRMMPRLLLETLAADDANALFPEEKEVVRRSLPARDIAPYNNRFDMLVSDLKRYRRDGYRVLLLSGSRTRAKRLVEHLADNNVYAFYSEDPSRVPASGEIMTYYGRISHGFDFPFFRFALISESDIFGAYQQKRRKKKPRYQGGGVISDFADLKVGDYVVHEDHGLGIYRGVEKMQVDKSLKDYIRIEYAEGGNLYVAATALHVIQKYASGKDEKEGRKPKLNRLGAAEWTKTKEKVQRAVDEIAEDLVQLYAKRRETKGYSFSPDTIWQQEFEDAFPYEETDDQITAIGDMKHDMESERIMDRLICGDVGFGKTEIAIRGAFKAVQDSKQVAVLVPTTILAQQHFNTFSERFRNFPVRIELLSRFRTQREQKKCVEDLKKGLADIVIGTHRLLSADVSYKDLGLLIVDEEQRFGVAHKEKIKKLKESVDVLTLTATPIPRTLHMSLVGIRDMSLLAEGPTDRLPIQTFVCEQNEVTVREAVMRELARGGQIYYVYNRVKTIADVAARLAQMIPEARIAYAHGQMPEAELEKIMYDFIGGRIDVLVSTTIIETGLDIPNVNTMIVHDSDRLGLAQLYQLRGRVGRSSRTAYAFLMYKRDKVLREVAEKRLNAIREFTDLGSGYKIAMRDLEIRGAGNLLGTRQSGHMALVGYEMYCRMLEEAVRHFKGDETVKDRFSTNIDLPVDAYIPETYILNEEQKLEIYKRIAALETDAEAEDMRDEMRDRFGEIPASVGNLIRISRVRERANALYITEIRTEGERLVCNIKGDAPLDPQGVPAMVERYGGRLKLYAGARPSFVLKSYDNALEETEKLLTEMERTF